MGVIRNVTSLHNSCADSIEDVLEELEEQTQAYEIEVRRSRRIKHRSSRPHAVGDSQNTNPKKGGKKKRQRIDNANFLMSLADPEETFELSIHDFIAPSVSVFSQVYNEQRNMEAWNEFINCSDPEDWFQNIVMPLSHPNTESNEIHTDDSRASHPAFSAAECYKKIDSDLRLVLRKKHVPMGALMYLERELVTFFINRPQSVFYSHIPNSFERLLLHALCQYMDLGAFSYNKDGARWTRVRNNKSTFEYPLTLLSTYLEQRMQRAVLSH